MPRYFAALAVPVLVISGLIFAHHETDPPPTVRVETIRAEPRVTTTTVDWRPYVRAVAHAQREALIDKYLRAVALAYQADQARRLISHHTKTVPSRPAWQPSWQPNRYDQFVPQHGCAHGCIRASFPCAIPAYICQRESHYIINIYNPSGDASGKYQFIRSTWNGFGGYRNAADAPESVQDEKARELWAGGRGCSHWSAC